MQNINIIIADEDEKYVNPLEVVFLQELGENVNIEIITSKNYLEEFFSVSREIEVLVIGESLFDHTLCKHNINHIVLLFDDMSSGMENNQIKCIYKYSSANTILHSVKRLLEKQFNQEGVFEKRTKVITVSSACGGVGKTTIAMGLAAAFSSRNYKVLFISAEHLHTYQTWFHDSTDAANDMYEAFLKPGTGIYARIKKYIRWEWFDYIPPFKPALCNLGVSVSIFSLLAKEARESGDYDVIIIDTEHVLDEDKGSLISASDILITVITQSQRAILATKCLLENIQTNIKEKFYFICNNFDETLKYEGNLPDCLFDTLDYISHIASEEDMTLERLKYNKDFQKLSYLLID